MARETTLQAAERRVIEQRAWIQQCGGDEAGYIARNGTPGEAGCHGDGGAAIYAADMGALATYEAAMRTARKRAKSRLPERAFLATVESTDTADYRAVKYVRGITELAAREEVEAWAEHFARASGTPVRIVEMKAQ